MSTQITEYTNHRVHKSHEYTNHRVHKSISYLPLMLADLDTCNFKHP